jgi:hypothetical protein
MDECKLCKLFRHLLGLAEEMDEHKWFRSDFHHTLT